MPAGLTVAMMLFAGAAGAAPVEPPASQPARQECESTRPTADTQEIVVCVQRMEGYRLNPDILEAERAKRGGGRPKPPERHADKSCETVGPMGCRGVPAIDLLGAAVVVGQMAARAARGENVGRMFVTDPTLSEYELYVEAKRQREEREADEALQAKIAKRVPDRKLDGTGD